MLHGVCSPFMLTTPTMGFSIAASSSPIARMKARCGVRVSPSLVMFDRSVRIRASRQCTRADFVPLLLKRQTQKSLHWEERRMTADTLAPQTASPAPPSMHRMIVAAMIGNVLEWFDFVVYGFFAVTIAEVFFPTDNPTVSLLITFGAFGLAYL